MSEQVVQASSPGLQSSTVEIPVSVDLEADGVLGVASRSVELALVDKQSPSEVYFMNNLMGPQLQFKFSAVTI